MFKTKKFIGSLLLVLVLLAGQVSVAFAAPPRADSSITGTVQSITLETDSQGVTTVLVTLDDGSGGTPTYRLSVDTALSLDLVTLDSEGNPVVNDAAIGTTITIDPSTVIADDQTSQNPVGSALANFFSSVLGVDYDTIMSVHDQGVGFGVIAQSLWLTEQLGGDTELFTTIVNAKQTGDYSAIVLPDGTSPQNWGQFRKALLDHKQNLGQIMSGHADSQTTSPTSNTPGNGNGHGNSNGHGNGNGHKP